MKKFLLSAAVIVMYGAYSLVFRHSGEAVVVRPASLTRSGSPSPTPTPVSSSNPVATPTPTPAGAYKDGTYTGDPADAFYGTIQVKATIQNGKITNVQFLQYPNDRPNSVAINTQAMPFLKQEAIQAQSAQVDIVSGATDTSMAFIQSLTSALSQATGS